MTAPGLEIKFDTANAAFDWGNGPQECARILRKIADQVENGIDGGAIHDLNGNRIGEWGVYFPAPEGGDE
jgi:hypothetical protein